MPSSGWRARGRAQSVSASSSARAAPLVIKALHRGAERVQPNVIADLERKRRTDTLDLDHVGAWLIEGAEIQRQDIGLIIVDLEVARLQPRLVQDRQALEHRFTALGIEQAKWSSGLISNSRVGGRQIGPMAQPHRQIADLDRVVGAKADMAHMDGLAAQRCRVVGEGQSWQRAIGEGHLVAAASLQRLGQLEKNVMLDHELVFARLDPSGVDDLRLPPNRLDLDRGSTTRHLDRIAGDAVGSRCCVEKGQPHAQEVRRCAEEKRVGWRRCELVEGLQHRRAGRRRGGDPEGLPVPRHQAIIARPVAGQRRVGHRAPFGNDRTGLEAQADHVWLDHVGRGGGGAGHPVLPGYRAVRARRMNGTRTRSIMPKSA